MVTPPFVNYRVQAGAASSLLWRVPSMSTTVIRKPTATLGQCSAEHADYLKSCEGCLREPIEGIRATVSALASTRFKPAVTQLWSPTRKPCGAWSQSHSGAGRAGRTVAEAIQTGAPKFDLSWHSLSALWLVVLVRRRADYQSCGASRRRGADSQRRRRC